MLAIMEEQTTLYWQDFIYHGERDNYKRDQCLVVQATILHSWRHFTGTSSKDYGNLRPKSNVQPQLESSQCHMIDVTKVPASLVVGYMMNRKDRFVRPTNPPESFASGGERNRAHCHVERPPIYDVSNTCQFSGVVMRGFCYQSLCPVGKKNEVKVLEDLGGCVYRGCVYLGTAINARLHSPIARALLSEVKKKHVRSQSRLCYCFSTSLATARTSYPSILYATVINISCEKDSHGNGLYLRRLDAWLC